MRKNAWIISAIFFLLPFAGFSPVWADNVNVVATTGYVADALKVIGGQHVTVHGLMGPGVDPHLYKAGEGDVMRLADAEIIFYSGLFLEAKMEGILKKMSRTKKVFAVTDDLPRERLLDSPTYQGHYDPHVWFDVHLWASVPKLVCRELKNYDPDNAEYYQKNLDSYLKKLENLQQYVHKRAQELPENKRVLVTAHDAFRYFGRAYGFEVVGLQGISTESRAGTKDVMNLAEFITKNKIKAIFVESSVPERNLRAVQEAVKSRGWDVKIGGELFSDALGDAGTEEGTYIGVVRHNIDTIVNALK